MNKWKNIICSMLSKLNIVKITTFPKLLCTLNKILNLQILILVLKHMFEKLKKYQRNDTEVTILVSKYEILSFTKEKLFFKCYNIS